MKISLSKPGRNGKQHIVMSCTRQEDYGVYGVFSRYVIGRGLPGRRYTRKWNRRAGQVVYRIKPKYLDRLLLTFPHAEISPGLEKRLSKEAAEEYGMLIAETPEFEIPGFAGTLYDFQKVSVHRTRELLRSEHAAFLNNDELGLGKTIQALATAEADDLYPCLAVVPSGLKWMWERMAHEFLPERKVQVVDGTASQRRQQIANSVESDITVINYEALRLHPEMERMRWTFLVADEYHRVKNPRAKQTKAFHKLQADYKLLMSGTPILNRPEEMWSPLHYAFPGSVEPTYYMFDKNHVIRKGFKVVGYKGLRPIRDFSREVSIRRRREQVRSDLPPVVYSQVEVELNAEQRRLYRAIKEELRLWMEDGTEKRIPTILARMTRLKQACFSPELYGGTPTSAKLDELYAAVEQIVASGEAPIIFTQWSKAAYIMARDLAEYNPAVVTGKVKGRKRMAQVDKFQEDEDCHLFIGTIGSCKEGFTLSRAGHVLFSDKDWVPSNNAQAVGRSAAGGLRGIGRIEDVNIVDFIAKGTIEEDIEELLRMKQAMINALVERDGGNKPIKISRRDIRELLAA